MEMNGKKHIEWMLKKICQQMDEEEFLGNRQILLALTWDQHHHKTLLLSLFLLRAMASSSQENQTQDLLARFKAVKMEKDKKEADNYQNAQEMEDLTLDFGTTYAKSKYHEIWEDQGYIAWFLAREKTMQRPLHRRFRQYIHYKISEAETELGIEKQSDLDTDEMKKNKNKVKNEVKKEKKEEPVKTKGQVKVNPRTTDEDDWDTLEAKEFRAEEVESEQLRAEILEAMMAQEHKVEERMTRIETVLEALVQRLTQGQ
jgi:hypothetical protein